MDPIVFINVQLVSAAEQRAVNLRKECFDIVKRIIPNIIEARTMTKLQIKEKCDEQEQNFSRFDDYVLFDVVKQVRKGNKHWSGTPRRVYVKKQIITQNFDRK